MLAALISALAAAGNLVIDKIALSRQRISLGTYLPIVFIFLFLFTLILVPFLGYINWDAATDPSLLFLLLLMVVIAIAWNVLFYQSVQKESIHEHELIAMTAPLITILLAAAFFPEEFNFKIFILGLISSIALIFAKFDRRHFEVSKTSYNLFLAVVLMSVESIIIKDLLSVYSPVALYAVRTFFIAIFFWFYYRPRIGRVGGKNIWLIGFAGLVGATSMLTRFYAFESLGLIPTTIIAVLAPIIVFIASWEILHERIKSRIIIASVVILICVTLATLVSAS